MSESVWNSTSYSYPVPSHFPVKSSPSPSSSTSFAHGAAYSQNNNFFNQEQIQQQESPHQSAHSKLHPQSTFDASSSNPLPSSSTYSPNDYYDDVGEDDSGFNNDAASSVAGGGPNYPKKSRITQACDPCRRRKRKCDGSQPSCSSCTKLGLVCTYQSNVKKRGPQPGVVKRLRQEVMALSEALNQEKRPSNAVTTSHDPPPLAVPPSLPLTPELDAFRQSISSANSKVRNDTYLITYFHLLNNTMFPLLEEVSFYAELREYEQHSDVEIPLSWNLRFSAALAVGAQIFGDVEYAQNAAKIARHAAAQLFDQPDVQVLRGMLVLAFYCLGTNQQSRTACYLAVANRMCSLLSVSPEVPVLATFMEDMLTSVNWWYTGFDLLPETGYYQQQSQQYPQDMKEYEDWCIEHAVELKVIESQLGKPTPKSDGLPTPASPSSYHPIATVKHITESHLDATSQYQPTAPPAMPPEEQSMRWELLKVMVYTSGMRGELNKPPSFSCYRCLTILNKAFISPLTIGALRTLILYFKIIILQMLVVNDDDQREVIRLCDLSTLSGSTHDLTHCPFYSICFHVISQLVLSHGGSEDVLAMDMYFVEVVARKWEFGLPMIQNLQARLVQHFHYLKKHPTNSELARIFQFHQTARAAYVQANGEGDSNSDDSKEGAFPSTLSAIDREAAEKIFSSTMVPSVLRVHPSAPSIVDTMNAINQQFSHTMKFTEQEIMECSKGKADFNPQTKPSFCDIVKKSSTSQKVDNRSSTVKSSAAAGSSLAHSSDHSFLNAPLPHDAALMSALEAVNQLPLHQTPQRHFQHDNGYNNNNNFNNVIDDPSNNSIKKVDKPVKSSKKREKATPPAMAVATAIPLDIPPPPPPPQQSYLNSSVNYSHNNPSLTHAYAPNTDSYSYANHAPPSYAAAVAGYSDAPNLPAHNSSSNNMMSNYSYYQPNSGPTQVSPSHHQQRSHNNSSSVPNNYNHASNPQDFVTAYQSLQPVFSNLTPSQLNSLSALLSQQSAPNIPHSSVNNNNNNNNNSTPNNRPHLDQPHHGSMHSAYAPYLHSQQTQHHYNHMSPSLTPAELKKIHEYQQQQQQQQQHQQQHPSHYNSLHPSQYHQNSH